MGRGREGRGEVGWDGKGGEGKGGRREGEGNALLNKNFCSLPKPYLADKCFCTEASSWHGISILSSKHQDIDDVVLM